MVADAPIEHIPVYVKAGSIIPMGPPMEYSSQFPDAPLEIRIYPGSNGRFTFYEDRGDTYDYQRREFASFDISWDNQKRTVTISKRTGAFRGMGKMRKFNLVLMKPGMMAGMQEMAGKNVIYSGEAMHIAFK